MSLDSIRTMVVCAAVLLVLFGWLRTRSRPALTQGMDPAWVGSVVMLAAYDLLSAIDAPTPTRQIISVIAGVGLLLFALHEIVKRRRLRDELRRSP